MDGEKQDQENKSSKSGGAEKESNQRRFPNPNVWLIGAILIATALMVLLNSGPQRSMVREEFFICLLYTSPSPRDATLSRMPSSA